MPGWWDSVKERLGLGEAEPTAEPELFVYVRIPASIDPEERGRRFEDPLGRALERHRVGEVSGGGTMLSDVDTQGRRSIEYCGVDVDLWNASAGLPLLREELRRLNAPAGTRLEYEYNGQDISEDLYAVAS